VSVARNQTARGQRKPKCSPTLEFHGVGTNAVVEESESSLLAVEAVQEVLADSGTLCSTRSGELIFGPETLLVTNYVVVGLGLINVVKQQLVGDVLGAGEHGHQVTLGVDSDVRHFRLMGLRNSPVTHGVQTVSSIELLHVHYVASHVNGSRVVLLLDEFLEHVSLHNTMGDALLTITLGNFGVTNVALLSKSGGLGFLQFGLLDLGQFDLTEGLLAGQLGISALHLLPHLIHLTLLLSSQGFFDGLELSLVSSEHDIDVLLVHVLQEFLLLVAQLLGFKGILLLLELVHELHLLLLHLVLPVEHSLLTVEQSLHGSLLVGFHVIHLLLLVTVSLAFERV